MKIRKTGLIFLSNLLFLTAVFGQSGSTDFFRNSGKIYVVVAVLAAILIGFLLCLVYMERRISKLEQLLEDD